MCLLILEDTELADDVLIDTESTAEVDPWNTLAMEEQDVRITVVMKYSTDVTMEMVAKTGRSNKETVEEEDEYEAWWVSSWAWSTEVHSPDASLLITPTREVTAELDSVSGEK